LKDGDWEGVLKEEEKLWGKALALAGKKGRRRWQGKEKKNQFFH